jgi:hypothetical protein
MFLRAIEAVRLLTRIRQEKPDLWKLIQEFVRESQERKAA